MNPRYSSVVGSLRSASIAVLEIGAAAKAAVALAGGRIVAMAISAEAPNLFWSDPVIGEGKLSHDNWRALPGGLGGDRLWFAPELTHHWDGPPDWRTMANYKIPAAADPGEYEFVDHGPTHVTLRGHGELPVHDSDRRVGFHIERTVRIAEPPLLRDDTAMQAIDYVGVETSHKLQIDRETREGVIGLWHLLQVPVGAVLIVPTHKAMCADLAQPLSYALPGDWVQKEDHIVWRYGGTARAKFGLSAAAVTGRAAVLEKLDETRWSLLVREFPRDLDARYCDHPYAIPRTDQVFQAWDGDGFGEMEFHSPALDAQHGPREQIESDRLWGFSGSSDCIARLCRKLLGVSVDYLFD